MATDAYRIRLGRAKDAVQIFAEDASRIRRGCLPDSQRNELLASHSVDVLRAQLGVVAAEVCCSGGLLQTTFGAWSTLRLSISDRKFYFIFHRFCLRDLGRFVQPALFWWGLRVAARAFFGRICEWLPGPGITAAFLGSAGPSRDGAVCKKSRGSVVKSLR